MISCCSSSCTYCCVYFAIPAMYSVQQYFLNVPIVSFCVCDNYYFFYSIAHAGIAYQNFIFIFPPLYLTFF